VYDIFNFVEKNNLNVPYNKPEKINMPVVTTSKRGQIVIPRDVRKQLRIIPGKRLLIKTEGDHAIVTPLPDDPVEHFCGIFAGKPSLTRALLEERKVERKHEAKKSAR
jgi:AbrB family looped-hinge helix DNA binding protein